MTDSEKMDLILAEIKGIKSEIQEVKKKIGRLGMGQIEIKKEQYMINRQIADTYKLAPDAWGQGVENRTWLENGTLSV